MGGRCLCRAGMAPGDLDGDLASAARDVRFLTCYRNSARLDPELVSAVAATIREPLPVGPVQAPCADGAKTSGQEAEHGRPEPKTARARGPFRGLRAPSPR